MESGEKKAALEGFQEVIEMEEERDAQLEEDMERMREMYFD